MLLLFSGGVAQRLYASWIELEIPSPVVSGDVTVALTGNGGTGSVGAIAAAFTFALASVAGTSSLGTLGVAHANALTGTPSTTAAGQVGTLGTGRNITGVEAVGQVGNVGSVTSTTALTGTTATGAAGNVVRGVPGGWTISGNEGVGQVGAVSVDLTTALTGVGATGSPGTLGKGMVLTGTTATGQVGTLGAVSAVALTGNAATMSQGNVSASIPGGAEISGNPISGQVGALGVTSTTALTGVVATGSVGTVGKGMVLTGVAAVGQVGTLGEALTSALTGNAATGAVGSVSASVPGSASIAGNFGTGQVGTVSVTLTKALTGTQGTGQVGTLSTGMVLTGVVGTVQVGNVDSGIAATVALTGNTATATAGDVSPSPSTLGITGNSATGAEGSVGVVVTGQTLTGASAQGLVGSVSLGTGGPRGEVIIVKIAPFRAGDVIALVGFQLYKYVNDVPVPDGPHVTTGIDPIPDVPNGYSYGLTAADLTVDADGGYRGVIVWDSGGGSPFYRYDEVYVPPASLISGGAGDCPSTAEIADAVWDEPIAAHLSAGSTGLALNDAGATGNPWNAVIEGTYTAQDLLRVMAAVAAGKTNILKLSNGATVTFRDITDTSDIVEAQMQKSNRIAVTITL